jgi:hypothetical protein
MKFIIALAMTLAAFTMTTSTAHAASKTACKVVTNDVGTITGRGPSSSDAFEDAATQCFDRREKLYKMKKGTNVDEESGLVMIDACANIKCS